MVGELASSSICASRTIRHWRPLRWQHLGEEICTIWNEAIGLRTDSRSWAVFERRPNAPIWMPVEAQPTMYRVILSTRAVSRNEIAALQAVRSGTRTSVRVIWPFWTTLSAILCSIFSTLKPACLVLDNKSP